MSETRDRDEDAAASAARELAGLHVQTEAARMLLSSLQGDVAAAESRLDSQRAARLIDADEQLARAVQHVRIDTDTAVRGLNELSLAGQLDALTGLPNRELLLDRFAQAIAAAKRHGSKLALLFVDLDNFKHINDTLGHAAGDVALQRAAQCLTSCVREADTVSRHGGDEFLVLLTDVSHPADAALIADKLLAALGAPGRLGEQELRLTASIGISIYPDDGQDAGTLIQGADAAMYRAKRDGLGGRVVQGGQPLADHEPGATVLSAPQRPLTRYEVALADQERRYLHMREANAQLILAALGARDLQVAAEQAHRQQTEFLAMLAHELRSPLTPIRTAAALLGRIGSNDMPRMQAIIERQVAHLTRLVGDLLDVSRVHTGKLRLERRRIDIADVIAEAVDTCRPAMDARLQHFRLQAPARALPVEADPVRLAQVLSNLLDNASKYTPSGGEVGLRVVVVDDTVVMTVSDSGIGISAEALPTVFEPFVQDSHAIGFNGVGLGIGLAVVRELVEAHGGSVLASSAGHALGSEFMVTLPLAEIGV